MERGDSDPVDQFAEQLLRAGEDDDQIEVILDKAREAQADLGDLGRLVEEKQNERIRRKKRVRTIVGAFGAVAAVLVLSLVLVIVVNPLDLSLSQYLGQQAASSPTVSTPVQSGHAEAPSGSRTVAPTEVVQEARTPTAVSPLTPTATSKPEPSVTPTRPPWKYQGYVYKEGSSEPIPGAKVELTDGCESTIPVGQGGVADAQGHFVITAQQPLTSKACLKASGVAPWLNPAGNVPAGPGATIALRWHKLQPDMIEAMQVFTAPSAISDDQQRFYFNIKRELVGRVLGDQLLPLSTAEVQLSLSNDLALENGEPASWFPSTPITASVHIASGGFFTLTFGVTNTEGYLYEVRVVSPQGTEFTPKASLPSGWKRADSGNDTRNAAVIRTTKPITATSEIAIPARARCLNGVYIVNYIGASLQVNFTGARQVSVAADGQYCYSPLEARVYTLNPTVPNKQPIPGTVTITKDQEAILVCQSIEDNTKVKCAQQ